MKKANVVTLQVKQVIPAYTTKEGVEKPERVYQTATFEDETDREITSEHCANFFVLNFLKYLAMQQLSKRDTFKLSKEIEIAFSINGKEGKQTTKFSTDEKKMAEIFERTPHMFTLMFSKMPNVASLTAKEAQKYIGKTNSTVKDSEGNEKIITRLTFAPAITVLAKAKKQIAPTKATKNVEEAEEVTEGIPVNSLV